jgi:hypothetical protein
MTFPTQGSEIRPLQFEIWPFGSGHDVVHVHGRTRAPIGTLAPGCLEEHLSPQEAPGGRGVEGEVLGAALVVGAATGPTAAPTRDLFAMGQANARGGPGHDSVQPPVWADARGEVQHRQKEEKQEDQTEDL